MTYFHISARDGTTVFDSHQLIEDYYADVLTTDEVVQVLKDVPKKELSALYYELLEAVGLAPCVETITPQQNKLLENVLMDESIYPDSYWDEYDPYQNR